MTDTSTATKAYEKLSSHLQKIAIMASSSALLEWDQQTKLPTGAGKYRSEQLTFFAGETHRLRVDPIFGELIQQLSDSPDAADPHSVIGCTIAKVKTDFDRQV